VGQPEEFSTQKTTAIAALTPGATFHGEQRRNNTHASKTDPEARLYKKSYGQEAKVSYLGHTVVENRNGLVVVAMATQTDGTAERDAGRFHCELRSQHP
jgi:hypothetical protein